MTFNNSSIEMLVTIGILLFLLSILRLKLLRYHTGTVILLFVSMVGELLLNIALISSAVWFIFGFNHLIELTLISVAAGGPSAIGYIERFFSLVEQQQVMNEAGNIKTFLEREINGA